MFVDDLRYIWVICGFETALRGNGNESDWCKMLTTEETHILEYVWELKVIAHPQNSLYHIIVFDLFYTYILTYHHSHSQMLLTEQKNT